MIRVITLLLILSAPTWLLGQTQVTLKKAGSLSLVKIEGEDIQKLKNSVWLVQGNTNIYCDSAYLNKLTNSAKAFGNVKIIDSVDPVDIQSEYLEYNGNTKIAKLRQNVVMKDDSVTLYTDNLDYDRTTRIGNYFKGGRLIDNNNDLTSIYGIYNTETKLAEFYENVVMTNPDFDLKTDTLYYDIVSSKSRTSGYTLAITADSDTLKTVTGLIYSKNDLYAEVYYGYINNVDFYVEADTIFADDLSQIYRASKNIKMISKEDSLTIYGNNGTYRKVSKDAIVYNEAYMRKMLEGDSLFISADTLYSNQKDPENKFLTAYHDVKMFKSNLQGVADSVSYNFFDSTIYMFTDPTIWAEDSQITADSINIEVKENKIDKMNLSQNSFVISKDSMNNFNQVRGRTMEIYFKDGFIRKTDVNGNGESIYYIQEATGATSMNKIKCSNMALYFYKSSVTEIRTYNKVDGFVKPQFEILQTDKRLRGFEWQSDVRPSLRQVARRLRYDR